MAKKNWDDLSPSYRKRLESKGFDRYSHADAQNIQVSVGHKGRYVKTKKYLSDSLSRVVPDVRGFDTGVQDKLDELWKSGFMRKGVASKQNKKDRDLFMGIVDSMGYPFETEEWEIFRGEYSSAFGGNGHRPEKKKKSA